MFRKLLDVLFGPPPEPREDEVKVKIEQTTRELDQRSEDNRARLAEIQVAVMARRTEPS